MAILPLKDLAHISFQEVSPYWEDFTFTELQDLYLDYSSVVIGYRGNLYGVDLRSTWNECAHDIPRHPYERFGSPDYYNKRFRISIFDLMNNKTVGDGIFDMAFPSIDCHAMPKVRKAIRNAIIKINMKSTDYYK